MKAKSLLHRLVLLIATEKDLQRLKTRVEGSGEMLREAVGLYVGLQQPNGSTASTLKALCQVYDISYQDLARGLRAIVSSPQAGETPRDDWKSPDLELDQPVLSDWQDDDAGKQMRGLKSKRSWHRTILFRLGGAMAGVLCCVMVLNVAGFFDAPIAQSGVTTGHYDAQPDLPAKQEPVNNVTENVGKHWSQLAEDSQYVARAKASGTSAELPRHARRLAISAKASRADKAGSSASNLRASRASRHDLPGDVAAAAVRTGEGMRTQIDADRNKTIRLSSTHSYNGSGAGAGTARSRTSSATGMNSARSHAAPETATPLQKPVVKVPADIMTRNNTSSVAPSEPPKNETNRSRPTKLASAKPSSMPRKTAVSSKVEVPRPAPRKQSSEVAQRVSKTAGEPPEEPEESMSADRGPESIESMTREVDRFVTRYANAFASRNLGAFLGLFDPSATENGKPVSELIHNYQSNFRKSKRIEYGITVQGWRLQGSLLDINGVFRLKAEFKDDTAVSSSGSIKLALKRYGDDFRVVHLDYKFW